MGRFGDSTGSAEIFPLSCRFYPLPKELHSGMDTTEFAKNIEDSPLNVKEFLAKMGFPEL